ncbi:hypothetical protein NLX83_28495 [Allokutzneria sp. A3M-2-11 16]|nr:hypothetical protein [Allokutzneria sp. A3M-2-11 16]
MDVGVEAFESCQLLARAGFTFFWHESEHALNRSGWPAALPGMPSA